jgi:hypothetical protein
MGMRPLRIVSSLTKSAPAPTVLDEARALVSGSGRFERGSAFEPLLVPLVARHAAPEEVWFTCYVGSLASRPNPRLGWPLLGIAVAREVAPLVTDEIAWDAIQTLPDLVLYLKPELLVPIGDRKVHERIGRRLGMRRGEPPTVDVARALQQPWDASGLILHFEYADDAARHADADLIMREIAGADRMRRLLYLALAAPYALDRTAAARTTLDVLDDDVPGWYWCTVAAHLGAGAPETTARARQCIPPVWADHYARLAQTTDPIDPIALPADAHPFGQELLALISQMEPSDRRDFAREVLNGVVDRWAIDVTLDDVPSLFAPPAEAPAVAAGTIVDALVEVPVVEQPAVEVPVTEAAGAALLPLAPPTGPAFPDPTVVAERTEPEPAPTTVVVLGDVPADIEPDASAEPEPAGALPDVDLPAVRLPERVPDPDEPHAPTMGIRVAVRDSSGRHERITRSFQTGSDHEILLSLPADLAGEVPRRLTVTLVHDGDRLSRVLPARVVLAGSSTVVPFSLYVRHDEEFVLATVTVADGDSVVAESVLLGDTGPTPDSVVGGSIQLRRR